MTSEQEITALNLAFSSERAELLERIVQLKKQRKTNMYLFWAMTLVALFGLLCLVVQGKVIDDMRYVVYQMCETDNVKTQLINAQSQWITEASGEELPKSLGFECAKIYAALRIKAVG